MIEFDTDLEYCTEYKMLDEVVLNDESGEMEPVTFVPKDKAPGDTSDGYHTFDELYGHRTGLLAALCNMIAEYMGVCGAGDNEDLESIVFKSRRHHDGDMFDGMFIVGVNCNGEDGPRAKWATWHCEGEWWDRFAIPELDRAPEWDGHTPADALARLVAGLTPCEEEPEWETL